jgi:hypothetical protein
MAKRYVDCGEGPADDMGSRSDVYTTHTTQYKLPEAESSAEGGVSKAIFDFNNKPIDPRRDFGPRLRHNDQQGEGLNFYKDATYQKLSDEISFLTSLVLETKHSQNSLSKRFKLEREFKHKGNKNQYLVIINALNAHDEIKYALSNNNIENAEAHLANLEALLLTRKTKILIADTSEFGWETVTAYENLEITVKEVDVDRLVKRAEDIVRAARKTKAETASKSTRGSTRGKGRGRGQSQRGGHTSADVSQSSYGEYEAPYAYPAQNYAYPPPPYPGHFAAPYPQYRQPSGPLKCYNCYGLGHTSKKCPSMQGIYAYTAAENQPKAPVAT